LKREKKINTEGKERDERCGWGPRNGSIYGQGPRGKTERAKGKGIIPTGGGSSHFPIKEKKFWPTIRMEGWKKGGGWSLKGLLPGFWECLDAVRRPDIVTERGRMTRKRGMGLRSS